MCIASTQTAFTSLSTLCGPAYLHAALGLLMAETSSMQSDSGSSLPSVSFHTKPALDPSRPPKSVPNLSTGLATSSHYDPSPRPGKRVRLNPPTLTAVAAMVDRQREERNKAPSLNQTTPNPAREALSALMGIDNDAISKALSAATPTRDTPSAATTLSEPMAVVAHNLSSNPPEEMQLDNPAQTSPVSLSSMGTLEGSVAPTAVAHSPVESPSAMDDALPENDEDSATTEGRSTGEGPKAFSYPGPLLQAHLVDARRGMSLPHSSLRQSSPRASPSTKKHRCPYCDTEFTRHHNLKSHLLTHSQEKPYVCSTCQSRFRRLHDLKRHTKLHTGERPHTCPKCGRKFARGDALARHNKGPGGCAGRRLSVGSYGGDDDFEGGNEESMEGLVYGEPEGIEDEEGVEKRPSMPSTKGHAPMGHLPSPQQEQSAFPARQLMTYPPIQGRPAGGYAGTLQPPRALPAGSMSSASQLSLTGGGHFVPTSGASSGLHPHGPGPTVFHGSISESPKPLSPGSSQTRQQGRGGHGDGSIYRNRSPSLTKQFQQQQLGRSVGHRIPTTGSMGAPTSSAPQLPPPHGLVPPDSRFTLHSQASPAHPPTGPSGPPTHMGSGGGLSSQSNSLSSHGHSAQGSGDHSASMYGSRDDRLWAYVKSLESRINGLQEEVVHLRGQLVAANQSQGQ